MNLMNLMSDLMIYNHLIFEIDEIYKLFADCGLNLVKHYYNCGNELFILNCIK